MKRQIVVAAFLCIALASYWLSASQSGDPEPGTAPGKTRKVEREPMTIWSTYVGRIEPRRPVMVLSRFRGTPTLLELAPEGASVAKNDVLARLDASTVEREVVKLEKEYAVAESELSGFRNAKAPIEIKDLTIKLLEVKASLSSEDNYLRASAQLAKEGLVSEQEVLQQKEKVAGLRSRVEKAELQLHLTKEFLHPAEIRRAQAKASAALNELQMAREQVREGVIRAPSEGIVIYTPMHIGPERRAVRVGDTLYANVPFMMLHDMKDMIVMCDVPEGELSKIEERQEVSVQPLAYPGLRLKGIVESISPMAQAASGRPSWQKTFSVVVRLVETDARLRPGMSVATHILSYHGADVVAVPRAAVSWENGRSVVRVVHGSTREKRAVTLGRSNERSYEVIDGLKPGSEVQIE
jgi:HlyD family secretion protein